MKLFAFVMSVWLLLLSCLPCGDKVECLAEKTQATVSATSDYEQHEHRTAHCTPFCTCECCVISVFPQTAHHYSFNKDVFEKKTYPAYSASFYGEIAYAIWQPPKLS